MRDLRLKIPDLTYAELVELGRSLIPGTAASWTDHNAHDPGVMMIELLASVADRQVYSLARTRRDERAAYARLMGVAATGPRPASGQIWPDVATADDPAARVPWPIGTVVAPEDAIRAALPDAPEFRVDRRIYLITAKLDTLRLTRSDGSTQLLTQLNRRGDAGYFPFGLAPDRRTTLELVFDGGDGVLSYDVGPVALSIGVRAAIDRGEQAAGCAALRAVFASGADERELEIVADGTHGFTRSGALLLAIDARAMNVDGKFSIRFSCPSGNWYAVPRVSRIGANVLPVKQQQGGDWQDFGKAALGIPDEEITASATDRGRPAIDLAAAVESVEVQASDNAEFSGWRVVSDFQSSGPHDAHVVVDGRASKLRGGNGVNGKTFSAGSCVQVRLSQTAGARGNLAAGQDWTVVGILGTFGTNLDALQGGKDLSTDVDLQIRAREKLRDARPIVSRGDLERAARGIDGVARAEELAPRPRGERRLGGERRLVVVRRREADEIAPAMHEPAVWLRRIHDLLARRLPLAQRLVVVPARYVKLRVRATLAAAPHASRARILSIATDELRSRFAVVCEGARSPWPFGRDVSRSAVAGWLRSLEGVARVVELDLLVDGRSAEDGRVPVPRDALPAYELVEGDVRVDQQGAA